MSTMTRPRGPRPARVYWARRLVVLLLAFALVYAIAHLLGAGVGPDKTPGARVVGAPESTPTTGLTSGPTSGSTPHAQNGSPTTDTTKHDTKVVGKPKKTKTPLAVPTGPCDDSDVQVTPSVDGHAFAGTNVAITLNLTTIESPACTWEVSPQSVVLKLTSGTDRIWSTQDCRAAMPTESVVVRKDHNAKVRVIWNGQRSDGVCSRTTPWAQPGYYHAEAAALGSDPLDVQFELTSPPRPTVTAKPTPQHKGQQKR